MTIKYTIGLRFLNFLVYYAIYLNYKCQIKGGLYRSRLCAYFDIIPPGGADLVIIHLQNKYVKAATASEHGEISIANSTIYNICRLFWK